MRTENLKYAVRRLIGVPGFTVVAVLVVAVLTLALGIGANTGVFGRLVGSRTFLARLDEGEGPREEAYGW